MRRGGGGGRARDKERESDLRVLWSVSFCMTAFSLPPHSRVPVGVSFHLSAPSFLNSCSKQRHKRSQRCEEREMPHLPSSSLFISDPCCCGPYNQPARLSGTSHYLTSSPCVQLQSTHLHKQCFAFVNITTQNTQYGHFRN